MALNPIPTLSTVSGSLARVTLLSLHAYLWPLPFPLLVGGSEDDGSRVCRSISQILSPLPPPPPLFFAWRIYRILSLSLLCFHFYLLFFPEFPITFTHYSPCYHLLFLLYSLIFLVTMRSTVYLVTDKWVYPV